MVEFCAVVLAIPPVVVPLQVEVCGVVVTVIHLAIHLDIAFW